MSKKPSGEIRKKGGVNKPSPSAINNKSEAKAPPREKSQKYRGKKSRKNELSLNSSDPVKEKYSKQNYFDRSAEDVLKKRRHKGEEQQYIKPVKSLPPAKEPSSPYKRRMKQVLFYAATIIILVFICCVLSLTVFFKIDSIEVSGETRYENKDIIASSQIKQGDNLILCNTSPGEKEIRSKFPYIENVKIQKKLFNKIVIEVKEATPTSIIESDGKYVLLSESGKIIDISNKRQSNVPIVLGAKLETPTLSKSVKYTDSNVEEYLKDILECAEKYELGEIEAIDITGLSKITLEIKQGLKIIIGSPENIDYKLKTAKKIMEKSVPENDQGTLDVSHASAEGGKSYFSSKKPEPSKSESSASSSKNEKTSKAEQSSQASKANSEESNTELPQSSEEQSSEEEASLYDNYSYEQIGNEETAYSFENADNGEYAYADDNTYDYNTYDDNGYTYDYNVYTYDNNEDYTYLE